MSFELVCGLETHVELATKTKIFCGCTTEFGGAPNTHCCPVCTGQPGALPSLNKRVVEYAIRAGLATNCKINLRTHMDRKNYTYPDMPKAYQISQFDKPLCEGGFIALDSGKKIRITRIHIEEDAGKLVHDGGFTFIDYNRCGVPLIEIVSEPDISSAEEAREYVEKLQILMRYVGVSDCKMQEGSMRCDVNVSIRREGQSGLNARTEIKNMNSVSFMERAINYEFSRQKEVAESGGKVEQATLRFDEKSGETVVMRTKENAHDYRYFPEPDIKEVIIPQRAVEEIRRSLPEFPGAKIARYVQGGVSQNTAKLISRYKNACDYIDRAASAGASVKSCVNLVVGTVFSTLATEEDKEKFSLKISAEQFAELVKAADGGKINLTLAQTTLVKMLEDGQPMGAYLSADDLCGVSDGELERVCRAAIEQNGKSVSDFLSGKEKAIYALYGFIKKQTGGKADIKKADEILRRLLNEIK